MIVQTGMKRRTIRQRLSKKVEDWLSSLPKELADKVRPDVLVTGGSIASMLLGEPIKDFDIYLRNTGTAMLLAGYYVAGFNRRRPNQSDKTTDPYARFYVPTWDRRWFVEGGRGHPDAKDGECMDEFMHRCPEHKAVGIFVKSAGVASDTDGGAGAYEYFEQEPADSVGADDYIEKLMNADAEHECLPEDNESYVPRFLSQNAISLSDKLQIVIRFVGELEEIHKNYDYVHATCGYDHRDGKLTLPPAALESMLARNLVYQGSLYPVCSVFRMQKFIKRGWRIAAAEQVKMCMQISELDLEDPIVLQEQMIGVDAAYFHDLIRRLRDYMKVQGEDRVDGSYLIQLIDELAERNHV